MSGNRISGRQTALATTDAIMLLRRLAVKAQGFSGADIERLVREARGIVRREGRDLAWADLETMLDAARPKLTDGLRRRAAIHEAGHAVVRHALGIGRVTRVTIAATATSGGHVAAEEDVFDEETEPRLMARLAILLAGRAAERAVLGTVSAGAGGDSESDLGKATRLAIRIETAFGLGGRHPLLHQTIEPDVLLLGLAPGTARRIHRRLRRAERQASRIVAGHRQTVIDLAARLLEVDTLQGGELEALSAGAVSIRQQPASRAGDG